MSISVVSLRALRVDINPLSRIFDIRLRVRYVLAHSICSLRERGFINCFYEAKTYRIYPKADIASRGYEAYRQNKIASEKQCLLRKRTRNFTILRPFTVGR